MPTSTDLEQTGRDANILNNYLYEEPPLLDASEYGRLGQLLLKVLAGGGVGPQLTYGGRVDTYEDLLEVEGKPNVFYFVGPEDATDFVEYIWAEVDGGIGHWDRVGGVSFIIDAVLSTTSTNPVQNRVVTAAIMAKLNAAVIAAEYNTLGAYVIGDYCLHDGSLFKAIGNVTAEAWDSSKWQSVTVMGELTSAISALAIVARTGDYNDLTNKPAIPMVSDRLKSAAAAAEYNSSTTYTDGDYFTFEGELYKVDSVNGQYISTGNLITAEVMSTAGGYIGGKIPTYTSGAYTPETFNSRWDYRTSGYIEVTPGMTLSIDVGGSYTTSMPENCDSFYNADKTRIGVYNPGNGVTKHVTRSYTIPANVKYVRIGLGSANHQPSPVAKLVRADMPKVRKTIIAAELGEKADASDLTNKQSTYAADSTAWDAVPTENSTKPVTSNGVYQAIKEAQETVIYGFHVDPNESDPKKAVTYLKDAVGMNPASMGSTKFDYGSWKGAFFMPKPCMLKFDGTVDYYLDQNDYSKKLDGTASDINSSTTANAMMEWPKIYFKFEAGEQDGEFDFYCSNKQVDSSYKCWCNIDANGNVIPHFYTAIYNGIITDNKMRSLSGYRLTPAIDVIGAYDNTKTYAIGALRKVGSIAYSCITPVTEAEEFDSSKWEEITPSNNGGTSGKTEVDAAIANNTTATVEWYTDVYSDRQLISALLILMSKCLDDQVAYGRGLDSGSQTASEAYVTGTLNNKGLFYGVTANGNSAVKVFGMENWYGCKWRRTAGLVGGSNNAYLYKLTYGTADGSAADGYNSSGSNYLTAANVTRPETNNYVTKMGAGKHGIVPKETAAVTSSLYYGVYHYNGAGYALFGGFSGIGLGVGSLCVSLSGGFSGVYWYVAASLSCKPKKAA